MKTILDKKITVIDPCDEWTEFYQESSQKTINSEPFIQDGLVTYPNDPTAFAIVNPYDEDDDLFIELTVTIRYSSEPQATSHYVNVADEGVFIGHTLNDVLVLGVPSGLLGITAHFEETNVTLTLSPQK